MGTEGLSFYHPNLLCCLNQMLAIIGFELAPCFDHGVTPDNRHGFLVNSFAPAWKAKKNVRKMAERKTVIINHN